MSNEKENPFVEFMQEEQVHEMLAAITQVQAVLIHYHHGLLDQGFTREEALTLTLDFQRLMYAGATGGMS